MDELTLRIAAPGMAPIERRFDRALLSIGSDPGADLRLAIVPARWAVLRKNESGAEVRRVGGGGATQLAAGARIVLDGIELSLVTAAEAAEHEDDGLPVQSIAERLAGAERPDEALASMIDALIAATGASTGAVLLHEPDGYAIPVARHADGRTLQEASELLSDTLVRDVLGGGATSLCIRDLGAHGRYANVPSVVSLKLQSVLCVPMRMGERVLGAVYLGRQRGTFSDAHARDLKVLASMALPVLVQLKRATERASAPSPIDELLVGESEPMARVRELVRRVAPSDLSVLILGETGTGKEVTARAIHAASARAAEPLVALNCAAVPESLLAVELFGCKKGAYTGAVGDRQGRIEAAGGSTLFLDEVGDMPISMQVALLRVLEDKKVTRVGENEERPVDFRLIAATSKDLDAEVEAGRFRVDLLYRLR
ncbi:MAG: sigma 54-interacting transcriptional regulator [Sandaracinaceae bacterium]|nr:sigma 54-interacting transcriptional regulator [Sandaracinaceae bacterium]